MPDTHIHPRQATATSTPCSCSGRPRNSSRSSGSCTTWSRGRSAWTGRRRGSTVRSLPFSASCVSGRIADDLCHSGVQESVLARRCACPQPPRLASLLLSFPCWPIPLPFHLAPLSSTALYGSPHRSPTSRTSSALERCSSCATSSGRWTRRTSSCVIPRLLSLHRLGSWPFWTERSEPGQAHPGREGRRQAHGAL